MASMWRKAMLYLGLGPDDEYEDDGLPAEPPPPVAPREPAGAGRAPATRPSASRARAAAPGRTASGSHAPDPEGSGVRTLPAQATSPRAPQVVAQASAQAAGQPTGQPTGQPEPVATKPRAVVRPIPASASAKPHVVTPNSFNHAQEVADKFKANQPVILNLQGAERDLARRLIDFSSGLCYGLGGHMEKVAHQVYLLTPSDVEVSADERRRLQERGLHDA
jgi:cell division inhibitor SepF